MIDAAAHRYKGTSPFQDSELDRKTFFGRDRELRDLENLLLAEDLVVLFARSGMGKSSLINAGLMKPLRRRRFLPVVARVNAQSQDLWPSVLDAVRQAAADAGVDCVSGGDAGAWDFFKRLELWSETDDLLRPVLVLDQFEELFTLQTPERRRQFVRQLGELIRGRSAAEAGSGDRSPPKLKILLSLREDFLADLEELSEEIPSILRNRCRLGALSREGARDAIIEPARVDDEAFDSVPFSYREEAVEQIIAFLGKRRMGKRTIEVDEVEPVQLQLICQYVEDQVRQRQAAGDAEVEVSDQELRGEEHMRKVLESFYERTVAAIGSRSQIRAVRKLCEKRLINSSGRRLMEDEEEIEQRYRIPRERLRQLVDARLLRAEPRLGGTFYELSHDTLVAPILQSRAKRRARARNLLVTAGVTILAVVGLSMLVLRGLSPPGDAPEPRTWQISPQLLAVLFLQPPAPDDPALEAWREVGYGIGALNQQSPSGAIISLQRLLIFLGYSTGPLGEYLVDGSYGPGTVRGVAQFQLEHGIAAPGTEPALVRPVTEAERSRRLNEVLAEIEELILPAVGDPRGRPERDEPPGLRGARSGAARDLNQTVSQALASGEDEALGRTLETLRLSANDRARVLGVVREARSSFGWSESDTVEAGLRAVEVAPRTMHRMLSAAEDAIAEGRIPFGRLESALSYLNALSDDQEDVLDAQQILETYGRSAASALEGRAGGEGRSEIRPAWVLTYIDAQSRGFPSSVFSQEKLAQLRRERPDADFAELRLEATFMGLGRIQGVLHDRVGAGSPREMFDADLESQVAYVARFLESAPGLAPIAAKASPTPTDFLRFVDAAGVEYPSAPLDPEVALASTYRTYRGREEEATQVVTTLHRAVSRYRGEAPSADSARVAEDLLPILSMRSPDYAEDFERVLDGRLSDARRLSEPAVRAIQRLLIFLGYATGIGGEAIVDGTPGPGLNRALAQFRHEHGLADLGAELAYLATSRAARKGAGSISEQPLDASTLKAMLSTAEAMLARETVAYGDRQAALFLLNSIEQRKSLGVKELFERYGDAASKAEEQTGTRSEWTLAVIKLETGGIPSPKFEQSWLYRLYRRSPYVDFAELRLRSTAMGPGRAMGLNYPKVGASSAAAMFMASLDEQVLHVARLLGAEKEIVANKEPSAADFRAVARSYAGANFEALDYHEGLERWFREFRQLGEPGKLREPSRLSPKNPAIRLQPADPFG